MLKYLIFELMGFGIFTVIYCCDLTGIIGFLFSLIGIFLITYSSYKMYNNNDGIQFFIDSFVFPVGKE